MNLYPKGFVPLRNYTTLKRESLWWCPPPVLYLYEITLLSNVEGIAADQTGVLYLYEITLLSNKDSYAVGGIDVLYLYEITLLSNQRHSAIPGYGVLYLYEITLLSNGGGNANGYGVVLYLYEITLLSNLKFASTSASTRRKSGYGPPEGNLIPCNFYFYFRIRTGQCQ